MRLNIVRDATLLFVFTISCLNKHKDSGLIAPDLDNKDIRLAQPENGTQVSEMSLNSASSDKSIKESIILSKTSLKMLCSKIADELVRGNHENVHYRGFMRTCLQHGKIAAKDHAANQLTKELQKFYFMSPLWGTQLSIKMAIYLTKAIKPGTNGQINLSSQNFTSDFIFINKEGKPAPLYSNIKKFFKDELASIINLKNIEFSWQNPSYFKSEKQRSLLINNLNKSLPDIGHIHKDQKYCRFHNGEDSIESLEMLEGDDFSKKIYSQIKIWKEEGRIVFLAGRSFFEGSDSNCFKSKYNLFFDEGWVVSFNLIEATRSS